MRESSLDLETEVPSGNQPQIQRLANGTLLYQNSENAKPAKIHTHDEDIRPDVKMVPTNEGRQYIVQDPENPERRGSAVVDMATGKVVIDAASQEIHELVLSVLPEKIQAK